MPVLRRAVGLCAFLAFSAALATETSLRMSSDPGDGVGAGSEYFFTPADGTFAPVTFYQNVTSLRFDGAEDWYLHFAAPGGAPLTVGDFIGASHLPFPPYSRPGISVYTPARSCGSETGRFRVREVHYAAPGIVDALWVVFEQRCGNVEPVLRGDIRFNAHVTVALSAPFSKSVGRTQPLAFDVFATDSEGRHVTLTAQDLPDGAAFTDHEDGTGSLSWTPGFNQFGSHDVTFVADNGEGGTDAFTTTIRVRGTTSLFMESDPGDWVGAGRVFWYTVDDGDFSSDPYGAGRGLFRFYSADFEHFWSLQFAAPYPEPLTVGSYTGAYRASPQSPYPGLDVGGDGRGCNYLTGSFDVKQVELDIDGITSFWATFEQHCDGDPEALRGEIRFNADAPVLLNAPLEADAYEGQEVTFDVTATDGEEAPIVLAAEDLPEGATFTDNGNDTGTYRWTPSQAQLGTHRVRTTASTELGEDAFPTRIMVHLANDDFDGAVTIPSLPFDDQRDVSTSSRTPDEPVCFGPAGGTVWYRYTPAVDTTVHLVAYGDYTTTISVSTGTRDALEPVACGSTNLIFPASAGQTYHILIGGLAAHLHLMAESVASAPANDDFDDATIITALPFRETLDTSGATTAQDDPNGCGGTTRTVWYEMTLTENAPIAVKAYASFNTYVSVLTGARGDLTEVACWGPEVHFEGAAGQTYYFKIATDPGSPPGSIALLVAETLELGAGIQGVGALDPRTGQVSVSGTVTCSKPSIVRISGFAEQTVDEQNVAAFLDAEVPCEGTAYWRAAGRAFGGRFQPGTATVTIYATAFDDESETYAYADALAPVQLRSGRFSGVRPGSGLPDASPPLEWRP